MEAGSGMVMSIDQLAKPPESRLAQSWMVSVHVPPAGSPVKVAKVSGSAAGGEASGLSVSRGYVPEGTAAAAAMAAAVQGPGVPGPLMNVYGPIRSDESPTPPAVVEPVRAKTCAFSPLGAVMVTTRSPTHVWAGAKLIVMLLNETTVPPGTVIDDVNAGPGGVAGESGINPPGPGPNTSADATPATANDSAPASMLDFLMRPPYVWVDMK